MTWIQRAHVYEYDRDGVKIEFTAQYAPSDGYMHMVHSVLNGQPTTDDMTRIYADIASNADLIHVVAYIDDDGNRIEKGDEGFTYNGNIYALENIGDYVTSEHFREYANDNPQEIEIFGYWLTVDGDMLDNLCILDDIHGNIDYSDLVDFVQSGELSDFEYMDGDDVTQYFTDVYDELYLMPDGVLLDQEPAPEPAPEPATLAPGQIDAMAENLDRVLTNFPTLKTELIARGWVVTKL